MLALGIVLVGLIAVLAVGCGQSRHQYEQAEYEVIETDGDFELRSYPSLPLVTTAMTQDRKVSDFGAFRELAGYITGDNAAEQEIAMTSPVFMMPGPPPEASEADKVDDADATSAMGTMNFVVPQDVAAAGTPEPTSANVSLESFRAGTYASLRFSGGYGKDKVEAKKAELLARVDARGLTPAGGVMTAIYDGPGTLPMMRRNEVLVAVEGVEQATPAGAAEPDEAEAVNEAGGGEQGQGPAR